MNISIISSSDTVLLYTLKKLSTSQKIDHWCILHLLQVPTCVRYVCAETCIVELILMLCKFMVLSVKNQTHIHTYTIIPS